MNWSYYTDSFLPYLYTHFHGAKQYYKIVTHTTGKSHKIISLVHSDLEEKKRNKPQIKELIYSTAFQKYVQSD